MLVAQQRYDQCSTEELLVRQAVGLLSQQAWCWGRDVLRDEGNWLLEIGFQQITPPENRKDCSSIYTLELTQQRRVMLRGFGVFYGDDHRGGVFLPRYEFAPRYTQKSKLDVHPWSDQDLPKLNSPRDSQRNLCAFLVLDLIDWIRCYEVNVVEALGLEYRRRTLSAWDNGMRVCTPPERIASAWRELAFHVAANFDAFSRKIQ